MVYCIECGEEVDEGYVFCPNCGHEVDPDDAGGGTEEPVSGGEGATDAGDASGDGPVADSGGQVDATENADAAEGTPDTWGTSGNTGGGDSQSTGDRGDAGEASGDQATSAHATGAASGASEPIETADWDDTGAGAGVAETNVDGPSPFTEGAFSFAVGYPTKRGWESVLLGAVIEFFGMFVPFINLVVRGFGFRIAGAAARGQTDPPEFDDYGEMFVDGFRFAAVILAWSLVGLFAGGLLFVVGTAIHEVLGILLLLPFVLVVYFAVPASLTAYAAHDEIGAAFSPTYAGAFALTGTYVKAWVLFLALSFVVGIVTTLAALTVIGLFVALPWSVYVYSAFWGYYYREAVEVEEKVPPADATPV